jgi:hypothetical protein
MVVKKTKDGVFLFFGHNTASFVREASHKFWIELTPYRPWHL